MKIKLPQEHMLQMKSRIRHFFWEERGEEIGDLAAGNLLEFMLRELAPFVYNHAIQDARTVLLQKMASMEEELFALEKPVKPADRK